MVAVTITQITIDELKHELRQMIKEEIEAALRKCELKKAGDKKAEFVTRDELEQALKKIKIK